MCFSRTELKCGQVACTSSVRTGTIPYQKTNNGRTVRQIEILHIWVGNINGTAETMYMQREDAQKEIQ